MRNTRWEQKKWNDKAYTKKGGIGRTRPLCLILCTPLATRRLCCREGGRGSG